MEGRLHEFQLQKSYFCIAPMNQRDAVGNISECDSNLNYFAIMVSFLICSLFPAGCYLLSYSTFKVCEGPPLQQFYYITDTIVFA